MKKSYRNWFISFAVVFSIPLLGCGILISGILREWKKDLVAAENQTAGQISFMSDSNINTVKKVAELLAQDEDVLEYCRAEDEIQQRIKSARAFESILTQFHNNDMIEDIYLVSSNSQTILSTRYAGNTQLLSLFDYKESFGVDNVEFWQMIYQAKSSDLLFSDGEGEGRLFYLYPVLTSAARKPVNYLLIRYSLLDDSISFSEDQIAYAGLDGSYLDMKTDMICSEEKLANLSEALPGFVSGFSGDKWYVVSLVSGISEIRYLCGIRVKTLYQALYRMLLLIGAVLGICILASVLLSCWFSKRNTAPISRLLSRIRQENFPDEGMPQKSLADQLEDSYARILSQKQSLESRIESERSIMVNNIFSRLLRGYYKNEEEALFALSDYNIRFQFSDFLLIMWTVNRGEDGNEDGELPVPESLSAEDLQYFLIDNVVTECLKKVCGSVEGIYCDTMVGFLLNFDRSSVNVGFTDGLKGQCIQAAEFLKGSCGLDTRWYMSGRYESLSETRNAFSECLNQMEEWMRPGPGSLPGAQMEEEGRNRLLTLVKTRQSSSAYLFNELIRERKEQEEDDNQLRLYIYSLLKDFSDILSQAGDEVNRKAVGEFLSLKQTDVLCQEVRKWLLHLKDEGEETEFGIAHRMAAFVHEHIFDPELSLAFMADTFKVSESYVSRLMKKELGTGMFQYVSARRVEQARFLLENTSLSVGEISQKVGYYSYRTMVRIFRQEEGVSPSDYRKMKAGTEIQEQQS